MAYNIDNAWPSYPAFPTQTADIHVWDYLVILLKLFGHMTSERFVTNCAELYIGRTRSPKLDKLRLANPSKKGLQCLLNASISVACIFYRDIRIVRQYVVLILEVKIKRMQNIEEFKIDKWST
jgi:hypothetical protein